MTQLQRIRRLNRAKRQHPRYIEFTITLTPWMYSVCAAIVCFGVVAKVFYDIGSDMTAYAYAEQYGFISPVPSPTPAPTVIYQPKYIEIASVDLKTEKQQIMDYIVKKFGDSAGDMITIINQCENHNFDQTAVNHNRNSSEDYGVAQINSVHIPKCGEAIKTSWKANIDCAYEIYKAAGNSFSPWSCSYVVGVKSFWQ